MCGVRVVAEFVDVEEAGAGDVRFSIFVAAAPAQGGHEPAAIDNDQVGLAEMLREPLR